ncbi:uncharacterized protein RJT21DRAFT_103900 [Scheffersomyces amazonensis]|uniref:uncharacterized protein n=1 Tax=Scheffersomyces amazonensis TaxID=1078765 RepID=UPI00315DAAC9
MDNFDNWNDVATSSKPVAMNPEGLDQYLSGYDEIDNLFNETLNGLQDLDVPSGFVTNSVLNSSVNMQFSHSASHSINHTAKHSRKISGTAIFGFNDHNRELSISGLTSDLYKSIKPSMDLGKSISPGELLKSLGVNNDTINQHEIMYNNDSVQQQLDVGNQFLINEEDEYEEHNKPQQQQTKKNDYIVTNNNPTSYKFPPSAPSNTTNNNNNNNNGQYQWVNNYSAKYLQDINNSGIRQQQMNYVDDIEPLLDNNNANNNLRTPSPPQSSSTPSHSNKSSPNKPAMKYVPIPIQQPVQQQQQQQQQQQPISINHNNAFLPPPSPPTLSHGSPEWQSSPEPRSPSPSPNRSIRSYDSNKFSSPIHQQLRNANVNFHTPQFFSEGASSHFQLQSSPIYVQHPQQMNSSPLRASPIKYYSSPIRNQTYATADDTIEDSNATITQLTPLKHNLPPQTPSNNSKTSTLEWSPIISPGASVSSLDLKKQIQQSSPRKRIKKTSLLPPGELDQYWIGPDENKVFTCTYKNCGKKFTRRYNVRSHIQTHLSDRPFSCSYCPKRFVRQHDLNRHVKGHLEARHCQCPCGKEFARLDALKKHRERNICVGGIVGCVSKPTKRLMKPVNINPSTSQDDHDKEEEEEQEQDHDHDQEDEEEDDDFLADTDDILLPIDMDTSHSEVMS